MFVPFYDASMSPFNLGLFNRSYQMKWMNEEEWGKRSRPGCAILQNSGRLASVFWRLVRLN